MMKFPAGLMRRPNEQGMMSSFAETDFVQAVSDRWIATGKELYVSAGYSCYCWLLGNRKDEEFDAGYRGRPQILKTIAIRQCIQSLGKTVPYRRA